MQIKTLGLAFAALIVGATAGPILDSKLSTRQVGQSGECPSYITGTCEGTCTTVCVGTCCGATCDATGKIVWAQCFG